MGVKSTLERSSHTLTGVWVEIVISSINLPLASVTPSRVCELKFFGGGHCNGCARSHPHGCVSWNLVPELHKDGKSWVTPSRVCELKWKRISGSMVLFPVTPSRVCELKLKAIHGRVCNGYVTPSRVCELKFSVIFAQKVCELSHPHGCVSWNVQGGHKAGRKVVVTPSRVCELKCSRRS